MKLQSLRALIAIIEHGSFSDAALELGTSQSTVSHAIAELEEELGVRLLDRGRFGAVATPVGERVIAQARNVERTLDAIMQEAALERGDLRGVIRVSAFRSVATHVLAPAVTALASSHPGLRVEFQELSSSCSSAMSALRDSSADLSLTMAHLSEDAVYWELLRDPYVVVARADCAVHGESVSLETLARQPLIVSDGPCSWPLRERLLGIDPAFQPLFQISEDSTILALAAQGLGVAVMPQLTVDALPAGTRQLSIDDSLERSVGVALMPGALRLPAVRAFLGVIRSMFPGSPVPAFGLPRAEQHGKILQSRSVQ